MVNLEKELRIGKLAVCKAAKVCSKVHEGIQTRKDEFVIKSDHSPVTIADYSSQAIIISKIKESFPNDVIVAEEDSRDISPELLQKIHKITNEEEKMTQQQLLDWIEVGAVKEWNTKGRFWTLDPIDGTKGFVRGDQYAVCLALIDNGEVILSIMACPKLKYKDHIGSLFVAIKGGGSFQGPLESDSLTPIKVSEEENIENALFMESVESGIVKPPLRMDSQCKYACIARGDASFYFRFPVSESYQEKIWDHAPGQLLVEEAGGIVNDMEGRKLDFTRGRTLLNNKGVIATTKFFYPKTLKVLKSLL